MVTDSTFDRLTRTLSPAERAELLDRVKGLGSIADEAGPDTDAAEAAPGSSLEALRLGLLARLYLTLVSFFTGKPRGEVLRDMAVRKLGEEVARACPGLVDPRRGVLLAKAREEFDALAEAAPVFRDVLRVALAEDQEEFVAFLAGHLLPHVQGRLVAAIDFAARAPELDPLEVAEVRRRVHDDVEEAVQSVPEEERRAVYAQVRALHRLRGLVAVPFGEMLQAFDTDAVLGECAFPRLRKALATLDAHLHAARRPPSPAALEGLFLFAHREDLGDEQFPIEERLTDDLGRASVSLSAFRSFDRRVPLTKIVRLATGDLDYLPRPVGGGEDWSVLFRRYWTSRVDGGLREYARGRERKRLVEEAESYLGVRRLPRVGTEGLTGIAAAVLKEAELPLCLVLGFSQEVFFRLARPFSMLIERARFVKEDNRRELAGVYGLLNDVDGRLDALLATIRADPELAGSPEDAEARRALEQRARSLVEGLLDEAAGGIKTLANILEGILRGAPGGRYDTVFNLDTVGDWQGKLMSEVLEEGYDRIVEGLALLGRIRAL